MSSPTHPPPAPSSEHFPEPASPRPRRIVFWLLLGIAAFYLLSEHRAHLVAGFSYLPILLLLACPLLHMFGHGGHGGHGGQDRQGRDATDASPPTTTDADAKAGRPHSHGGDMP